MKLDKHNMTETSLGSVISINPSSIGKNYPFAEIEYIDISSVGSGVLLGTTSYNIIDAPSRAKRLVSDGDTILSTVRPNRRSFLFIKKPPANVVVSTGFAVLRASEKINPRFLYYTVTNQSFTDYLTVNAKGAAYPAVDTDTIARAKMNLPDLSIQQKIASILSAYDDLIENNNRRIKILEEMAQAIYREWFVNFRFPGHEKAKMVKSALGMIPEAWEVVKIGDNLRKINRKPRIKKEDYLEKGDIPAIDQSTSFIGGYTNDMEALHETPLPIIVFGDHTRIVKYIDFPFASGADGTQLLYPKNEELMPAYFFYAINNIDLSNFAYVRHFKFLKEQNILIPRNPSLKMFNETAGSFLECMTSFRKQNDNLRKTRDLLLQKLISGKIDVEKIRIQIDTEVT